MTSTCLQASSKLRVCSQLLSNSLLNVSRSQDDQPLFWFLSEFPLLEGRSDSLGNLWVYIANCISPSHSCSLKPVINLEPNTVLISSGHFPTHSSLTAKHNHPHPGITLVDSILPSPFVKIDVYHNSFQSWYTYLNFLANLNGKLNIGNTTAFEKLSTTCFEVD